MAAASIAGERFSMLGTPRIAHGLAVHLIDRGHDVFVTTEGTRDPGVPDERSYRVESIGPRFSLSSLARFAKLSSGKCDVIHLHGGEQMSYYARLLRRLTPIPVVFTFTFVPSIFRKSLPRRTRLMLSWLSKVRGVMGNRSDFDHSIALSDFAKRRLIVDESFASEDVSVVKYGISNDYFEADGDGNAALGLVAYTAGADEERGVRDFILAARTVRARHPKVRFAVLPRDSLEFRRLSSMCADGIEVFSPNYFLTAVKPASLVVMPFRRHVAVDPPLSLLECMALGKVVVATPVGSIPEVLGNDRGWIVPPNNPAEIANAECGILDDMGLGRRIATAAREYSHRVYNWDTAIKSIESIYEKVHN